MMKKNLLILVFSLFLILGIFPDNIAECYKAIPEELIGYYKFTLAYKNNKWISINSGGQEKDAIVDDENNYLRIENTDAQDVIVEVKIYPAKKNYSIVAISVILFYMKAYSGNTLVIYKFDGSNWLDVTDKIFPSIYIRSFYDEEFYKKISGTSSNYLEWFGVYYSLPRFGTKLSARLEEEYIGNLIMDFTSEDDELYKLLIEKQKYKLIEIEYDAQNENFFLSNKIPIKKN